jgi:hypothetical protein
LSSLSGEDFRQKSQRGDSEAPLTPGCPSPAHSVAIWVWRKATTVINAGKNVAILPSHSRMQPFRLWFPVLLLVICAAAPLSLQRLGSPPVAITAGSIVVPPIARPQGEDSAWWYLSGAAAAAERGAAQGRARNLILFVGDGMGMTTVAAARILEGQRRGPTLVRCRSPG